MRRPPFHLVSLELSHDTMEALRTLSEDAQAGKLLGIAFVAMFRGRTYVVDAAGEAHRNPTFTLGMVQMLDDHLRGLIKEAP